MPLLLVECSSTAHSMCRGSTVPLLDFWDPVGMPSRIPSLLARIIISLVCSTQVFVSIGIITYSQRCFVIGDSAYKIRLGSCRLFGDGRLHKCAALAASAAVRTCLYAASLGFFSGPCDNSRSLDQARRDRSCPDRQCPCCNNRMARLAKRQSLFVLLNGFIQFIVVCNFTAAS